MFAGLNEQEVKAEMWRISDYERWFVHASLRELRVRAAEVMGEREGIARSSLFSKGALSPTMYYNAI